LKRLAKDRGETIQIKGYAGKDYEQVFDPQGKAIGKKDAGGNFIPYKPRGRPIFKISKTIPSHATKAKSSELEDMLNLEVMKRERPPIPVRQLHEDSQNSEYNLP
jgi:hypothetical protein